MTEEEWLACQDVTPLIDFLYAKASDRKFRLFGCGCCRRVWHIYDPPTRSAVEVAERFADGIATSAERAVAARGVKGNGPKWVIGAPFYPAAAHGSRDSASDHASVLVPHPPYPWVAPEYEAYRREYDKTDARERLANIPLLRDIFGNPFRPVAFKPAWLTSTVIALAQQMYESRDFGAMPILADALQDSGCDNEDMLNHCRGSGPHVRGCWVVDLVLGKS